MTTLTCGAGSRCCSHRWCTSRSRWLRTSAGPAYAANTALREGVPARAGYRVSSEWSSAKSRRRSCSARSTATAIAALRAVAARSSSVRAGVVIGSPRSAVTSSSGSARGRCTRMPSRDRRPVRPRTVTWITAGAVAIPHAAAAEPWLRWPSRSASTAAQRRPSRPIASCPTAYTPRWRACSRPLHTRRSIASADKPRGEELRTRHDAALRRRPAGDPERLGRSDRAYRG